MTNDPARAADTAAFTRARPLPRSMGPFDSRDSNAGIDAGRKRRAEHSPECPGPSKRRGTLAQSDGPRRPPQVPAWDNRPETHDNAEYGHAA